MDVRPLQESSRRPAWLRLICLTLLLQHVPVYPGTDVGRALEPGDWGGRGAAMQIGEPGAIIEFDCAFGYIEHLITVDRNGRFSVEGRYVRETGGPGRSSDRPPPGKPAIFTGKLNGMQMILQIHLPEDKRDIGPFTIIKQQQAELEKCL